MIILGNLLIAIAMVLRMILSVLMFLIIARAIVSWVNADPYNPIVRFLRLSTDPIMEPFQRKIPVSAGGVDFTPLIVLILIFFLQAFLVQSIVDYGLRIKSSSLSPSNMYVRLVDVA